MRACTCSTHTVVLLSTRLWWNVQHSLRGKTLKCVNVVFSWSIHSSIYPFQSIHPSIHPFQSIHSIIQSIHPHNVLQDIWQNNNTNGFMQQWDTSKNSVKIDTVWNYAIKPVIQGHSLIQDVHVVLVESLHQRPQVNHLSVWCADLDWC